MNILKKLGWVALAVVAYKFGLHLFHHGFADFDLSTTGVHLGFALAGFTLASWDWPRMRLARDWVKKQFEKVKKGKKEE